MSQQGGDVSGTRLYLGGLPPNATKADIESHFQGGEISDVKLMNGFGFIEYRDGNDARDAVQNFNGSDFLGKRLTVQFARGGNRPRDAPFPGGYNERPAPRTRRTVFRLTLTGLPQETSWQDLKDFTRLDGLDVVYSEVARERDGRGFVEYETGADLDAAAAKIDGMDFKGSIVHAVADIQAERPRDRFRSRSPPPRRGGGYGGYGGGPSRDDYHDRRGPPRGYSPRGYRDRSPPRRDYYDSRDRGYGRSSPPPARSRGPPTDDYPPPRRGYQDDGYGAPAPRGEPGRAPYGGDRAERAEPYANGGGRGGYDRGDRADRAPPSPKRARSPAGGRGGYDGGYERRGYW